MKKVNSETTDKPKPQRIKIAKKVIEDRLISVCVFDAELMLKDFENSELELINQSVKNVNSKHIVKEC